ncbi:MAG: hypothetical protein V4663_13290 [Bacteroidota bacterium]
MGILDFFKSGEKNSYLKELSEYAATEEDIKNITDSINKNGYWEEHVEWRISTVTSSKIEPKIKDDMTWYITTVKCEQEVMIPAASLERAIVFKKIYERFFVDLFYAQRWASHAR